MKKGYTRLAFFNVILAVVAICLYLPYTLEGFNMAGFEWFKFVPDMLKDKYFNVLIYFGIFLLVWFIVLNLVSILSHLNLPKLMFKLAIIVALSLPLVYISALKFDAVAEIWVKNIAPNIKTIAYSVLCISCGSFGLGLIYNFTRSNKANLHHIVEALVMCILLILMIVCYNWCGWDIEVTFKIYGILIGLLAMYLPISAVTLLICRNKRC